MSQFVFKLPDLGEGTVEAEIVAWRVKPGDVVTEDDVIVEVMTEKAAVEVPAPVSGKVVSTTGQPGDMVPVGAALIVFDTGAGAAAQEEARAPVAAKGAGTAMEAQAAARSGPVAAAASGGAAAKSPASAVAAGAGVAGAGVGSGAARAASNGAAGAAQVVAHRGRVSTSPAIRRCR